MSRENNATSLAAVTEWKRRWPLVLASWIGCGYTGIPIASLSALTPALQASFGWSRAEIALGLTIHAVVGVIGGPILGWMLDRWGPRRVALPGVILSSCAFALFGTLDGSLFGWLAIWFLYSVFGQLVLIQVWSAAIASDFVQSRSLALGTALTGSAAISAFVPISLVLLTEAYSWRAAYVVWGVASGLIGALVVFFLFRSKRDLATARTISGPDTEAPNEGMSTREALRTPTFAKLALITFFGYAVCLAISAHMVPILQGGGLSYREAALAAGAFGLAGVAGKLTCGALAMRVRENLILAALLVLPMGTCVLMMDTEGSLTTSILAIGLLGFSASGQVKMLIYIVTMRFGLKAFGTIFGFISALISVTAGIGPFLAGFSYDLTGSYFVQLSISIPILTIGALLALFLGQNRPADSSKQRSGFVGSQTAFPSAESV